MAGLLSLSLGYRLFAKFVVSVSPSVSGATNGNSDIESSVGIIKINIRNAAPGTAFAFFGAVLIIVMLVQSRPSVTMEWAAKANLPTDIQTNDSATIRQSLTMRGDGGETIASITDTGRDLETRGDLMGAQGKYYIAVKEIAEPINDLAWSYYRAGRPKDAFGLATIAVQLVPDEPRYADTLKKTRSSLGVEASATGSSH